jgi:hypothetical protein
MFPFLQGQPVYAFGVGLSTFDKASVGVNSWKFLIFEFQFQIM